MRVHEKLKIYFELNGVKKTWFTEKLGITNQMFYHIMSGNKKITPRMWKIVMELTGGFITIGDLLREEYRNYDFIEIVEGKRSYKCEVIVKDILRND